MSIFNHRFAPIAAGILVGVLFLTFLSGYSSKRVVAEQDYQQEASGRVITHLQNELELSIANQIKLHLQGHLPASVPLHALTRSILQDIEKFHPGMSRHLAVSPASPAAPASGAASSGACQCNCPVCPAAGSTSANALRTALVPTQAPATEAPTWPPVVMSCPYGPRPKRPSFLDIGEKTGTDKTNDGSGKNDHHYYQRAYEYILEPLRDSPMKLFEIGLGCDMAAGPGRSVDLWLEYFPNIELHEMEYNAACVEKFKSKLPPKLHIHTGDQSDIETLKKMLRAAKATAKGRPFDVMIDDGSHVCEHQKKTMAFLLPYVRPGGYYIIEDLHTSYLGAGFAPGFTTYHTPSSAMEMVKELLDGINLRWHNQNVYPVSKYIRSVHCWEQICAFHRNELPVPDDL
eukprot:TRINITY_DN158_c0_g1_i4.p1 TRINITY_DN158_c0_g1~~TRINITY_DN158_c0_g1_i4.p1  ORF type:complete len:402 (+),score=129.49 TRINITY_DN158_c0_g1_i4:67-1272(+)